MKLSNNVYDVLKWLTNIVIPSALSLLLGLNSVWNWGLPVEAISVQRWGSHPSFTTRTG